MADDSKMVKTGSFGFGASMLLFKNQFKQSKKDPDLVLYIVAKEKKKDDESESKDDDLPF